MTEGELLSHYWSAQSAGANAIVVYMSVLSAYLVVAFIAGKSLSRSQVVFVTSAYLVFSVFSIWGILQYYSVGHDAYLALDGDELTSRFLNLNPALIAAPMLSLGVIGALKFMWDVRHP